MSSPLKDVSVKEIEAAIAEALQKLSAGKPFTVEIGEMKFNPVVNRVDLVLSAWVKHEQVDGLPF